MFCGKCGQGLAEGTNVCPNCGNVLTATVNSGTGRVKSTFSGGSAPSNPGNQTNAELNKTQPYSIPVNNVPPEQSRTYGQAPTPPASGSAGSSYYSGGTAGGGYSGGGSYSGGYYGGTERTTSYGGGSGSRGTSSMWGIKVIAAIVLALCVFLLPITVSNESTGMDMVEVSFDILENIFDRMEFIVENLDNEYVLQSFLSGIFVGLGVLMYVFSSLGVLAGSLMNRKGLGKSFAATGLLGLVLFFLGVAIEMEDASFMEYLDYGFLVNVGLYITCAVISGKE